MSERSHSEIEPSDMMPDSLEVRAEKIGDFQGLNGDLARYGDMKKQIVSNINNGNTYGAINLLQELQKLTRSIDSKVSRAEEFYKDREDQGE